MEYDEFLELAIKTKIDQPRWRMGQTLMNVLYDVHPDLYGDVTATGYDPFFREIAVRPFLDYIKRHWNDIPESQMDS